MMPDALHILCFGDSITAGWSQWGAMHPYASALEASLNEAFPSLNVTADVYGLPGDQVVSPPGRFLSRMSAAYAKPQTPYDWAIVLGGTNDLAYSRESTEIFSALGSVWSIPLSHSAKLLALTVPECGYPSPELDDSRDSLNQMIEEHEAENFYTFDLHAAIPYWRMPREQRNVIWQDGVHFTPKGYDLMGKLIGERLVELISKLELEKEGAGSGSQSRELK